MINAEAAHASIIFGAEAKNPLLARTLAQMALTLLENPTDDFDLNDNTLLTKVMTNVMGEMINEAAEEMTAISNRHVTGSVEEQLGKIFSKLSEE